MSRILYELSRWVFWVLGRLLLFAHGRGKRCIPRSGGVLLVANHASFLDPALLGTFCPRPVHFVARSSLLRVPLVGLWMRHVGVICVDRDTPAAGEMRAMMEHLARGRAVTVFPEGTRTPDGRVYPFKRGLLLLLKKTEPAVVPVGIRGTFAAFPRGRRFPRPFRRCTVTYGPPMTAAEVLADGGLEELRRRVAGLCGQPLAEG